MTQHNITSTLKKKGSVIVSFFEIALKNDIFRLSLGCIVAAIAVYVIYRLRHVIGRALDAALKIVSAHSRDFSRELAET